MEEELGTPGLGAAQPILFITCTSSCPVTARLWRDWRAYKGVPTLTTQTQELCFERRWMRARRWCTWATRVRPGDKLILYTARRLEEAPAEWAVTVRACPIGSC